MYLPLFQLPYEIRSEITGKETRVKQGLIPPKIAYNRGSPPKWGSGKGPSNRPLKRRENHMVKKPVVVIFSGGLDSTTLLYQAQKKLSESEELYALSIDYGQRHRVELEHAAWITNLIGVPHQVVDLRAITKFLGGSSQTDPGVPVPHGHYAEESMKATVVPNRNMIMLSVAIGYAESLGGGTVLFGAHAGDHAIYPDCRPEFARVMDLAAGFAGWNGCAVEAPFIELSKTDIARRAFELEVPVAMTWSCYEGGKVHCGRCGTCVERILAIRDSGNQDPTVYSSSTEYALAQG